MNEIATEPTNSSHPNVVEIKEGTITDNCSTTAASSVSTLSPLRDASDNLEIEESLQDTIRDQAKKQQEMKSSSRTATDPPPAENTTTFDDDKADFFSSLELTESRLEKVETIIENEVQLRLQIRLLEIDAIAKKDAAEKALAAALSALNQITDALPSDMEEEQPQSQLPLKSNENSVQGKVDAISVIISTAEKEAVAEDDDDNNDNPAGKEEESDVQVQVQAEVGAVETEIVETRTTSELPVIVSPPAIVRQTEVPEETDKLPDDATPKASNEETCPEETPKKETITTTNPREFKLEVITSNLSAMTSIDEGIISPRSYSITSPRSVDDIKKSYSQTMEDTLEAMVIKIEECAETIRSPAASMEDQIAAAGLAAQYAKTVKAFQNAL